MEWSVRAMSGSAATPGASATKAIWHSTGQLEARRVLSVTPLGMLTAIGTAPGARTVVAIPGCHVTLQLGLRRLRRVVQCPEVLPKTSGGCSP